MQPWVSEYFSRPRASTLSGSTKAQWEMQTKSPSTTPRRKRPKLKSLDNNGSPYTAKKNNLQQMIIDVGQKNIGMGHCITCGMVYSQENPKDVQQHEQFHNRFTTIRNFRVTLNQIDLWKRQVNCNVISSPVNGILFQFTSASMATIRRKIESMITNYINEELGYPSDIPTWDQLGERKALVFTADPVGSNPPFIAGLLLIDSVKEVFVMPEQKKFQGGPFLGIDRIWVHPLMRRKGIATFLLDSARYQFSPEGQPELKKTRVAFSDPNDLGIKLALSYMGQQDKENGGRGRYITYTTATPTTMDKASELVRKLSSASQCSSLAF